MFIAHCFYKYTKAAAIFDGGLAQAVSARDGKSVKLIIFFMFHPNLFISSKYNIIYNKVSSWYCV